MNNVPGQIGRRGERLVKCTLAVLALAVVWNSPTIFAIGEVNVESMEQGQAPWQFPKENDRKVSFRAEASRLLDADGDGNVPDALVRWMIDEYKVKADGSRQMVSVIRNGLAHDRGRYFTFDIPLACGPGEFEIETTAFSHINTQGPGGDKATDDITIDIVGVKSLGPVAGYSKVGVNTSALDKENFNLTTAPDNNAAEHAMASWSGFPDMSTVGTYTVGAEIGDSSKSCEVEVSDGWIQILGLRNLNSGFTSTRHVKVELRDWPLNPHQVKIVSTASDSSVYWDPIDDGHYGCGDQFTTTRATSKHQDITVGGDVGFDAYGVSASVNVSTTVGWQQTEQHTMVSGGNDREYQYLARHYQGVVNVVFQHTKYKEADEGDDSDWVQVESTTSNIGESGLDTFDTKKWKKSASEPAGDNPW